MKIFHCNHCGRPVFFENTTCVRCGSLLAYLPDLAAVGSLDSAEEGLWRSPAHDGRRYRLCLNYRDWDVCNWAVASDDPNGLCRSCRLTRTVPDRQNAAHRAAWYRLEVAKRRLVYTLMNLRLPVVSKIDDPESGLVFDFLSDDAEPTPVMTGHLNGVISINVAEADDAERERRRVALHEPYRTLLGHLRHESGHYYWDRLLAARDRLARFRELFGDEQRDYGQALQAHYEAGPPGDWPERFVTAYASAHPWEDWAETWAHYLHMTDTLETAAACGLKLKPLRTGEPRLDDVPPSAGRVGGRFDRLIDSWFAITYVLNNLNRGMGLPDAYPFVLSAAAIEKLRFVHDTIDDAARRPRRQRSQYSAPTVIRSGYPNS
jgi:hypothetical protein